ncbi:MAG: hypothetical protein DME33_06510 [Verrucomicrobia bacterium]|nr:MAG: hypothetical protein DME33_06510 [Verrucomicrobiota bacterium]
MVAKEIIPYRSARRRRPPALSKARKRGAEEIPFVGAAVFDDLPKAILTTNVKALSKSTAPGFAS